MKLQTMKILLQRWLLSCLVTSFGLAQAEVRSDTHPTYDFAYTVQGDPRIAPLQVFDDGRRTYLQFGKIAAPPAIFASTTAGQILLAWKREGQFTILDHVERQILLTLGGARATVRYTGTARRTNVAALFGPATPLTTSAARPVATPAPQILASRRPLSNATDSHSQAEPAEVQPQLDTQPGATEAKLILTPGARIKTVLASFLRDNGGVELVWRYPGEMIVEEAAEITALDFREVLAIAFRRLGLRGEMDGRELVIYQKMN